MSVKDIYKQINKKFAKSNRYEIVMSLPSGLFGIVPKKGISDFIPPFESIGGIGNQIVDQFNSVVNIPTLDELVKIGVGEVAGGMLGITLNCESVQLPGISLSQNERRTYGPTVRVPNSQIYQEIPMTFYCSENHKERKYFELWHSFIFNRETNDYNFSAEYTAPVEIRQLDEEGNVTYKVKLVDAFPIAITPIDFSYASGNAIARFTVSISFTEYLPILLDPIEEIKNRLF